MFGVGRPLLARRTDSYRASLGFAPPQHRVGAGHEPVATLGPSMIHGGCPINRPILGAGMGHSPRGRPPGGPGTGIGSWRRRHPLVSPRGQMAASLRQQHERTDVDPPSPHPSASPQGSGRPQAQGSGTLMMCAAIRTRSRCTSIGMDPVGYSSKRSSSTTSSSSSSGPL